MESGHCLKCQCVEHSNALYGRLCPDCRVWGIRNAYRPAEPDQCDGDHCTGEPILCPCCRRHHLEFVYGTEVLGRTLAHCGECGFLHLDGPVIGAPYRVRHRTG